MQKEEEYQCNKHQTLEELLDFYKEAAADYDKVTLLLTLLNSCYKWTGAE